VVEPRPGPGEQRRLAHRLPGGDAWGGEDRAPRGDLSQAALQRPRAARDRLSLEPGRREAAAYLFVEPKHRQAAAEPAEREAGLAPDDERDRNTREPRTPDCPFEDPAYPRGEGGKSVRRRERGGKARALVLRACHELRSLRRQLEKPRTHHGPRHSP